MKYKASGAIAIPKASWGCAPALPNRIWVVFLEESCPLSADSEAILSTLTQLFSLLQLHLLKLSNSNKVESWKLRLQVRARQRGNCSTLEGKSRGGTPFCRMRKTVFSKRSSLLGIPPESDSARLGHIPSLPWESQLPLKPCISLQPFTF